MSINLFTRKEENPEEKENNIKIYRGCRTQNVSLGKIKKALFDDAIFSHKLCAV